MDTTKTLLKSAKHFFSGTLLSRLTGVVRDMTMAYIFGAESSIAAFLVAYRFAHLFRRVFGEGAMQMAFIPKFEELRNGNPAQAYRFFIDLLATVAMQLLLLISLFMLGIAFFLKWGGPSPGNAEIATLTFLMMPSLFFICLFGLNSSLLQCEKNYFIPSAAPVFFNLCWISGALLIAFFQPKNPMFFLSFAIIFACMAQWFITFVYTLKTLKSHKIKISWKELSFFSKDLKMIGKPFLLGVLGIAAAQINSALDGIFARLAESKGPAFLWYAIRIQQVPIGLFAIAFSGALLPPLSRAMKAGELKKFYSLLSYSIKKCLWIMIPASIIIFFFGKLGIRIVYGHGHFNEQDIIATSHCLFAYTLGLIPMALILITAPAFYSRNNYAIPSGASVVSMFLNVGLNALFIMKLGLGATSVALATSLSAWVNFFILAFCLKRANRYLLLKRGPKTQKRQEATV